MDNREAEFRDEDVLVVIAKDWEWDMIHDSMNGQIWCSIGKKYPRLHQYKFKGGDVAVEVGFFILDGQGMGSVEDQMAKIKQIPCKVVLNIGSAAGRKRHLGKVAICRKAITTKKQHDTVEAEYRDIVDSVWRSDKRHVIRPTRKLKGGIASDLVVTSCKKVPEKSSTKIQSILDKDQAVCLDMEAYEVIASCKAHSMRSGVAIKGITDTGDKEEREKKKKSVMLHVCGCLEIGSQMERSRNTYGNKENSVISKEVSENHSH